MLQNDTSANTSTEPACDGGFHMWEVLSRTKRKCRGCGLVATSEPTDTASAIAAEQGISRATVIRDGKRAEELDRLAGKYRQASAVARSPAQPANG
jgi:hypothetical protein